MKKVFIFFVLCIICLTASAQFSNLGHEVHSTSTTSNGFQSFLETGYTFGDKNYYLVNKSGAEKDGGRLELLTSFGSRVNDIFYVGAGVGVNYYTDADIFTIPLYADLKAYIPVNSLISPYIDLKSGYAIGTGDYKGGLYIDFTAGIEISGFIIGIGYVTQSLKYKLRSNYYSDSFNTDGLILKVGYAF